MGVIYKLPKLSGDKGNSTELTEQHALSMIRLHGKAREDKRIFIDALNDIRRTIEEGNPNAAVIKMREYKLSYKEAREPASAGLASLVEASKLDTARLVPGTFHMQEDHAVRAVAKGVTKLAMVAAERVYEYNYNGGESDLTKAKGTVDTIADATRMFMFNEHKTAECISSGLIRYLESNKSDTGSRGMQTSACIGVIRMVKDNGKFNIGESIKEVPSKIVTNLMKSGLPGDAAKVAAMFLSEEDLNNIIKKVSPGMHVYKNSKRKLRRGANSTNHVELKR